MLSQGSISGSGEPMKKKIALLIIIALAIGLFYYFNLGRYLTLESLKTNRDYLLIYYANHKLIFIMSYIGIYTAQTALSLPGAAILTLAGGAIFGALMGTIWVNIGATMGAVL